MCISGGEDRRRTSERWTKNIAPSLKGDVPITNFVSRAFLPPFAQRPFGWDWANRFKVADRAIFKWMFKIIARLRLLRLMTGLRISRQFFNQWQAKSNQLHHVRAIFPALSVSYRKLLGTCSDWFIALFVSVAISRRSYWAPSIRAKIPVSVFRTPRCWMEQFLPHRSTG